MRFDYLEVVWTVTSYTCGIWSECWGM